MKSDSRKIRKRPSVRLIIIQTSPGSMKTCSAEDGLPMTRGIYAQASGGIEEVACYHPILPVERLKNLETGEEQIKLAYKRNHHWQEIIVPKTMITSANKIVALSGRGIAVTSENARLLVKYLADVENGNDDYIDVQYSSSKLGWIGSGFIPYDNDIILTETPGFGKHLKAYPPGEIMRLGCGT